jgi:hypothetical protein
MTLFRPRRLNIRELRIAVAAIGATAACIAAAVSLWGEPHVVRIIALACGALLATLAYEPLNRIARPPQVVAMVADWSPVAVIAMFLGFTAAGDLALPLTAAVSFAAGAIVFAAIIVRDWLFFTVLRENA